MQTFDAHEPVSDDLLAQAVADLKSDPPQQMLTRQSILRAIRDAIAAEPRKLEGLRAVLRDQLRFEIRQRSGSGRPAGRGAGPQDLEIALQAAQEEEAATGGARGFPRGRAVGARDRRTRTRAPPAN